MKNGAPNSSVLCVGRLYCDLIFTKVPQFPSMGTEVFAEGLSLHAGGGAFITAAHLSRLGIQVSLAAFLPKAPFEKVVRKELEHADLDLTLCEPSPAWTDPQLTVAISDTTDRAFLTRRSGEAYPSLTKEDLQRLSVSHVHIGELATLVEKPEIVEVARSAGASVSLDCGWDESLTEHEITSAIKDIDLFLPNQNEFSHLSELGVSGLNRTLTVVKQGSGGATAYVEGRQISDPALSADVVDSTGAGDAFNAGFVSAWIQQKTLQECLRAGNEQGAEAISQIGGT